VGELTIDRRKFLAGAAAIAGAGVVANTVGLPGTAVAPVEASATSRVPDDLVPHTRTWMAWPDRQNIWGPDLPGVQGDIAKIAKTIAAYEPVTLLANPGSAAAAAAAVGPGVTVITSIPVDDCWTRDTGPVFRLDSANRLDAVGLNFNGWGDRQIHARDKLVAKRIAALVGVQFTAASFVGEGGAIETDGRGTLMATASSLVNDNRNPGKNKAAVAAAMKSAYGASQVIWFPGVRDLDITDDHVDATSRFVSGRRATVQWPTPGDTDPYSVDAREQYRILNSSTNANGQSFNITKIQGPDYTRIRRADVEGFVGSYANYYVCNGAVISAQFGDGPRDAAALATLRSLFPGRTVVQLNIDNLAAGGGGIHCVTQQQPVGII
jgi:agmatine deiminase